MGMVREFYFNFFGFQIDWKYRFGVNFPFCCRFSESALVLQGSEHHSNA